MSCFKYCRCYAAIISNGSIIGTGFAISSCFSWKISHALWSYFTIKFLVFFISFCNFGREIGWGGGRGGGGDGGGFVLITYSASLSYVSNKFLAVLPCNMMSDFPSDICFLYNFSFWQLTKFTLFFLGFLQKSFNQVETSAVEPISSILEIMDDSVKLPQVSQLAAHHQHFSRGMPLRNPRYCSRKYYRRNLANHADASTSHGKVTSPVDENLFFKLATRYRSDDSRQHTGTLEVLYVFCINKTIDVPKKNQS